MVLATSLRKIYYRNHGRNISYGEDVALFFIMEVKKKDIYNVIVKDKFLKKKIDDIIE